MPFRLDLPGSLAKDGWRVKIYDEERLEPPHVTIIRHEKWRFGLRPEGRQFMDKKPPGRKVPRALVKHILENINLLIEQWNTLHPENPV